MPPVTALRSQARARRAGPEESVLVLHGYGIRLALERGHLLIEDGIADRRRVRRLSRIDRQVKRIAIIGHAGTISLDAIRWLHDVKIPLVHLDTDGRVLALVAPDSPDHPTLRRAQARAADSEVGITIMRGLLRQKLDGQERVLQSLAAGPVALPQMELGRRALAQATDFITLRAAESQAAGAYWTAWGRVPVEFPTSDWDKIPQHWRTFGQRVSALTGSPRLAVNPANALLNYLYGILEAEARLALLAVGCDPGLGIQHADQRSRDSMACDVMEAVRPEVDTWLHAFLSIRTLHRQDFFELRNGQCRLMPNLARELAQTAALWGMKLGPVVEGVAQELYEAATRGDQPRRWAQQRSIVRTRSPALPTPLTEQNRKRGRPASPMGEPLASGRTINSGCPAMTREEFLKKVVPALRRIPVAQIAATVGLSEVYCAKIRGGRGVPHRSRWQVFAQVVGVLQP